tara:strand:- start:312 stop:473 length:162 start_codon:yes stop_codon:yes gene_type:complete
MWKIIAGVGTYNSNDRKSNSWPLKEKEFSKLSLVRSYRERKQAEKRQIETHNY